MAAATRIKIAHEMTAEEAAELISQIALGVSTGEVWLETEETAQPFHPASPVQIEIKGAETRDEGKLTIQVTWKPHLRIYGAAPYASDQKEVRNNGKRRKDV
jgi:amphi-Trp domain-containing protein